MRILPAALVLLLLPVSVFAADASPSSPSELIFLGQLLALLACGRLLGELMQRIGQPAVMGQLIGGVLLGPSVLGALLPQLQHSLFPAALGQKAMIDAIAQLGILLLLLLTGMETDLSVVRTSRKAAFCVSIAGIFVPFLLGVLVGELLPIAMLADPGKRLITALFLGTALAISSVKIVPMVVREVGFLRRNVGQIMIAAAIIDDTIGWIIISIVLGLARNGAVDLLSLARSLLGTAVFIAVSFTIGRHLVFRIIRWANDQFVSDFAVVTAILVVTGVMALLTAAIGVQTVLGAFIAGILVGQSPILTRHIDQQLRGLIAALFMPVFFGMAGLTTNLAVLGKPNLLLVTFGLIAIASLGKFSGAFLGGRLGGMTRAESLALGCGMNARGSTEVIIASFGLSMGVLNQTLFTTIVTMAVVTTLSMPPLLRRALTRLPLTSDEAARLEREEIEERGFVPNIERLLVAVDASPSGLFASRLAGLLAGARGAPTTVIHFDYEPEDHSQEGTRQAERTKTVVKKSAELGKDATSESDRGRVDIINKVEKPSEDVITEEAKKGYGLLFIGREPASEGDTFHQQITRSVLGFAGPFAIAIARGTYRQGTAGSRFKILVPVTGTAASRRGAELAIALAQASRGSLSALHVTGGENSQRSWQRQVGAALAPTTSADAIIREIVRLGDPYGVDIKAKIRRGSPSEAILRELAVGNHNLLVMGVSPRPGDQLFFGEIPAALLEQAQCSIVFVAGEPVYGRAQTAVAD
ncbi:MAG: cation:proton antiporter [Alphaproteobacteria bacterium]|nr:cation:proton antiporter [Alphaproteobacteria bacterium]